MKKSGLTPRLLRAAVYGANDGIVTTFAVAAGVAGADHPLVCPLPRRLLHAGGRVLPLCVFGGLWLCLFGH